MSLDPMRKISYNKLNLNSLKDCTHEAFSGSTPTLSLKKSCNT